MISSKVFNGSTGSIQLSMRDAVQYAVNNKAGIVVLAHNHPHGKMEFSQNDLEITRKLAGALKFFDIDFYDHILVSGHKSISWRRGY